MLPVGQYKIETSALLCNQWQRSIRYLCGVSIYHINHNHYSPAWL